MELMRCRVLNPSLLGRSTESEKRVQLAQEDKEIGERLTAAGY